MLTGSTLLSMACYKGTAAQTRPPPQQRAPSIAAMAAQSRSMRLEAGRACTSCREQSHLYARRRQTQLKSGPSPRLIRGYALHKVIKVILRSILITRLGNSIFSMQIIISMIALPSQLFALLGHPCFFFLLSQDAAR